MVFQMILRNPHQIAKIDGCDFSLIGHMPKKFELGACQTTPIFDQILLCFGKDGKKSCQTFDGAKIYNTASSKLIHSRVFKNTLVGYDFTRETCTIFLYAWIK